MLFTNTTLRAQMIEEVVHNKSERLDFGKTPQWMREISADELAALIERGLVIVHRGVPSLTDAGRSVRDGTGSEKAFPY